MSRAVVYIPSGDMCVQCVHALQKCDHLRFDEMRVIATDASDPGCEYLIVRCSEYHKSCFGAENKVEYKRGVEVR